MHAAPPIPLGQLQKGQSGQIVRIVGEAAMVRRLMEMGLIEGAMVEVMHEAPLGGDPLAVRVRGSLLALRRDEASLIQVQLAGGVR